MWTRSIRRILGSAADTGHEPAAPDVRHGGADGDGEFHPKAEELIRILRAYDGRMRQSALVAETTWSKSTVSRTLSDLEQRGHVTKIRVGRGNVVTLSGSEPAWYRPPVEPGPRDASRGGEPGTAETSRHVLLVEDDPPAARLIEEAFVEAGLANPIHVVRDGLDAVEFLTRGGRYVDAPSPGLVLLDLDLLVVDGMDVLVELDETPPLVGLPVLVLTESSDPDDVRTAYDVGATAYLTKPTDFDDLVVLVESIADFWLRHTVVPTDR